MQKGTRNRVEAWLQSIDEALKGNDLEEEVPQSHRFMYQLILSMAQSPNRLKGVIQPPGPKDDIDALLRKVPNSSRLPAEYRAKLLKLLNERPTEPGAAELIIVKMAAMLINYMDPNDEAPTLGWWYRSRIKAMAPQVKFPDYDYIFFAHKNKGAKNSLRKLKAVWEGLEMTLTLHTDGEKVFIYLCEEEEGDCWGEVQHYVLKNSSEWCFADNCAVVFTIFEWNSEWLKEQKLEQNPRILSMRRAEPLITEAFAKRGVHLSELSLRKDCTD